MSLLGNIWVKLGLKSDDFNRGLDNAEKSSKSFGEVMRGVAAKVTAVIGALKILGGTVKTITDFEAAQSRLASILGTTVDKMGTLTDAAIDLGRRTQYTASQVTDLQTELAKLGFAEPEILAMQESVLKFAAAVGTDLASAAARAGATMRGFGLTADETGQMLEVMAVSTSKSALSFGYLDSTLGKLIPVTRAVGLDTEATIALLGTLANAGIDASSAGTALRRVMGELGNGSSKLVQALGQQPKTMEELIDGLARLKDGGMGVTEAFDLVGKYAGPAFLALVNGADDCRALYAELGNTNGALDEMYETMTHNVKGAVEEVKSAWEGFVLSLRGSTGILYTVLTNVRDLISELNYALFQGTKESTAAATAYDILKRTIAETSDPVAALDIAYKRMLATANAKVSALEEKSALGRLLNHDSLEEARAQVTGLTTAYQRLRGEMTDSGKGPGVVPVTGGDEADPLADLLKQMAGGKVEKEKDGLAELNAEVREYAQEVADATAYDEQMRQTAAGLYETMHQEIGAVDETTAALAAMGQETVAAQERVEAMKETMVDAFGEIHDAIIDGAVGGLEYLAEALGSGEWDTAAFVKSLVGPLADAAIAAGTLILTTGEGLESIKAAFASLNGMSAIAAGAALVGLGLALKTGMAALASSGGKSAGSGSTYSNPYTYAGGFGAGVNPAAGYGATVEITGDVTVKGQDLHIALSNYDNDRRR